MERCRIRSRLMVKCLRHRRCQESFKSLPPKFHQPPPGNTKKRCFPKRRFLCIPSKSRERQGQEKTAPSSDSRSYPACFWNQTLRRQELAVLYVDTTLRLHLKLLVRRLPRLLRGEKSGDFGERLEKLTGSRGFAKMKRDDCPYARHTHAAITENLHS